MVARYATVDRTMLESCLERFDHVRKDLSVTVPEGTMYKALADSGLEMVDCYRTDCGNFIDAGDFVTAFAAINYAHSWIRCFSETGFFSCSPGEDLFLSVGTDIVDGGVITEERMGKYLNITSKARKKVVIASPVRSFGRRIALRYLDESDGYFRRAVSYRNDGDYVRAFASVNYSHAWLDAGARIGIFDVGGDDVLFTLFE